MNWMKKENIAQKYLAKINRIKKNSNAFYKINISNKMSCCYSHLIQMKTDFPRYSTSYERQLVSKYCKQSIWNVLTKITDL